MSHGPLHGTALRHPGGVGGGRGGGGAMVPVPGAPMDETQVKRAELVESPTTRLAFKVRMVIFFLFFRFFRDPSKSLTPTSYEGFFKLLKVFLFCGFSLFFSLISSD